MAYVPHQVQPPVLIFLGDGSEFEVLRSAVISKDGKPYLELILSPFPWVMDMLGIKDSELSTKDYAHGVLKRSYPRSRIIKVSENPEKPVWVAFTTFNNDRMSRTKDLASIMEIVEKNEALESRVKVLEAYSKRLEKENYGLSLKTKEFLETIQNLGKPERSMLPAEVPMETEVKQKVTEGGR